MPRVNIESLFPGVFPVYINHVIARLPSKRHPWCLQRYQSSPTSRHTWVFFRTKKMPLTRFLPKKRRSPTVSYAKPKIKNTWKTSNPSEKILDVCLLCHVCFFLWKETSGMPICFTEPGPSTYLESPSFLRCQETSWSTYSSGSGLSTSARLPGPGWTSLISREIFHDFTNFTD